MKVKNEKGQIFYGLHFYPGVAEYSDPGKDPYRVFLNEDTLRDMDPTFAGRPVFVHHVDDVNPDVDALNGETDGWVVESFFNAADGKHWVKFLVVSEKAEQAIKRGWRLSNCYVPKNFGPGGLWNGVSYKKQVTGGEYEHLAIVPNPRYEESVIMTPDEFKAYNERNVVELEKLKNDNDRGEGMKFFKRQKIENATVDLEMLVQLEKSKREVSLGALVTEADELAVKKNAKTCMANGDDHVDMGEKHGGKMTVNDLIAKHQAMYDEMEAFKKKNVDMGGEEAAEEGGDADHEVANDDDDDGDMDDMQNKEDDEDDAKKKKTENALEAKRKAKEKADRVRNANKRAMDDEEVAKVDFGTDKVKRGQSRYGS